MLWLLGSEHALLPGGMGYVGWSGARCVLSTWLPDVAIDVVQTGTTLL